MNKALITIAILALGVICGIVLRDCGKKPIFDDSAKDSADLKRIAEPETALKQIKPYSIHDTVTRLQTAYRDRLNTVERWVYDSAWNTFPRLLDTIGIHAANPIQLQRLVGERLVRGQRDSSLLRLYQNVRASDSTRITILTALDSLKSDRISNLSGKVEIMQQKAQKREKWAKAGHWIGGILFGTLILLK